MTLSVGVVICYVEQFFNLSLCGLNLHGLLF